MFAAHLGLFFGCVLCASCATLPTTRSPGCESSGVHYKPGETFKPSPCDYCTCTQSGRPMCVIQDCAYPPCDDYVHEPDYCCPVCPNGYKPATAPPTAPPPTPLTTPTPHCERSGVYYKPGETFQPSPCESCTCTQSGRPTCATMACMYPQCADAVREPDKCCPVCPNGPTCKHTDGTIIKHGEQYNPNPYTTCECPPSGFRTMAICVVQPQPPTPKPQTLMPLTPKPQTPKPLTPKPQTPKPLSDIDTVGQK